MATQTAESLVALLGGGRDERAAAYAALEAAQDAALGAGCVAALAAVLGQPAAEVDVAEHRRCCLVLAHLGQLDWMTIGAEWNREMRFLAATAAGNAFDEVCAQPAEQLTKEDVRTLAAPWAIDAALEVKGWDAPCEAGGVKVSEAFRAFGAQENAWNAMKEDEEKSSRIMLLVVDLLREDRAELSEADVAGIYKLLNDVILGKPGLCLAAVQAGAVALMIEELRTGSPADWVSIARNRSGRFGAVLFSLFHTCRYLDRKHTHLAAATPRLLDVFLDFLKAFEAAGSPEDANPFSVLGGVSGLLQVHKPLFELGEVNRAAVRGAASGLRFALDHPLGICEDWGINTGVPAVRFAALLLPN